RKCWMSRRMGGKLRGVAACPCPTAGGKAMWTYALTILAALGVHPAVHAHAQPGLARAAGPGRYEFSEPHMGTQFKVIVYADDEQQARAAAKAAFARADELNHIMSDYDPASELMRLCARAGGDPVPVSKELFFVLTKAEEA